MVAIITASTDFCMIPALFALFKCFSYSRASLSYVPNAVAFHIDPKISSETDPRFEYALIPSWLYFTINLSPADITNMIANTLAEQIMVSFQYFTNPTTKAVKKFASPVNVKTILCPMPSWKRFISAVRRVPISPVPILSKKAMFWRNNAAKYSFLTVEVMYVDV